MRPKRKFKHKKQYNKASTDTIESQDIEVPEIVNTKTLLQSGAHFGSKREGWCPKMAPLIYGERNGVFVIDLDYTMKFWEKAKAAIYKTAFNGGSILFVGTKPNYKDYLKYICEDGGINYVFHKWKAGALTNFDQTRASIEKLQSLNNLVQACAEGKRVRSKKELLLIKHQITRLERNVGGLVSLYRVPDLMFVANMNENKLAIDEARTLGIPVIALSDTDTDPTKIEYPIPANDDAVKSVRLFINCAALEIARAKNDRESMKHSVDEDTEVIADAIEAGKVDKVVRAKEPDVEKKLQVEVKQRT